MALCHVWRHLSRRGSSLGLPYLRELVGRAGRRATPLSVAGEERPAIAIAPSLDEGVLSALEQAGGQRADPSSADGLVWTDARDPEGLRSVLRSSPVRWVQLPFAGIERFVEAGVIDADHTWTCAKGAYGPATGEHALALMLAAARRLHVYARLRSWDAAEEGLERRLAGSTVVVFGAGGIGKALIDMLVPLGPKVVAVNRSGAPVPAAHTTIASQGLAEVLPGADWVVITAPLTPETKGLFGPEMLSKMGSQAWLINVARGGIVDTEALVDALRAGRIGGAALDVTDPEPLPDGHPLWSLENAIVTPHVANTWEMALPELRALVGRNVAHFAAGEPLEGVVDPATGY
jgi:phosphoglycerate dehydrogenase-like enzyme